MRLNSSFNHGLNRRMTLSCLCVLALVQVGCGTTHTRTPTSPSAQAPVTPPKSTGTGGYYLDDGPGVAPPNIDSIPDAKPRAEALLVRNSRAYAVFGVSYQPMSALVPFKQKGFASWYGKKFHGQKTSSGEIYDMYAMTAAHPTLPIPSYVKVTHLRNGKSVVVRVNDRGPFLQQRVIDLSYTAAAKLGYISAGSAEVEVELITKFDGPPTVVAGDVVKADSGKADVLRVESIKDKVEPQTERLSIETIMAPISSSPPSPPTPSSSTPVAPAAAETAPKPLYLQLGAFGAQDSADIALERMARQLSGTSEAAVKEPLRVVRDGALFKVYMGPYASRELATVAAEKIRGLTEFKPFTVQRLGS
jgi:rare lipoprotein A